MSLQYVNSHTLTHTQTHSEGWEGDRGRGEFRDRAHAGIERWFKDRWNTGPARTDASRRAGAEIADLS